MPDESGRLSTADKEFVAKTLTEKKSVRGCPFCGHEQFSIGDQLVLISLYAPRGFLVGAGYPTVAVICDNCAFFRFHSAVLFGFVKTNPEELTKDAVKKAEGTNG